MNGSLVLTCLDFNAMLQFLNPIMYFCCVQSSLRTASLNQEILEYILYKNLTQFFQNKATSNSRL